MVHVLGFALAFGLGGRDVAGRMLEPPTARTVSFDGRRGPAPGEAVPPALLPPDRAASQLLRGLFAGWLARLVAAFRRGGSTKGGDDGQVMAIGWLLVHCPFLHVPPLVKNHRGVELVGRAVSEPLRDAWCDLHRLTRVVGRHAPNAKPTP